MTIEPTDPSHEDKYWLAIRPHSDHAPHVFGPYTRLDAFERWTTLLLVLKSVESITAPYRADNLEDAMASYKFYTQHRNPSPAL